MADQHEPTPIELLEKSAANLVSWIEDPRGRQHEIEPLLMDFRATFLMYLYEKEMASE